MPLFSILLGLMAANSIVGGITGLVTGEGLIPGMIQGANIVDNWISGLRYVGSGDFMKAGQHVLGMSRQVISDIETGEFKERRPSNYWARLGGAYDYRDKLAHSRAVGTDLLMAVGTVLGAKALSKYGSGIKEFASRWTIPFIAGSQIGKMQGGISFIGEAVENLDLQFDNFQPGRTVISVDTATGDPSRHNILRDDDDERST
jgi:hypothetical protein